MSRLLAHCRGLGAPCPAPRRAAMSFRGRQRLMTAATLALLIAISPSGITPAWAHAFLAGASPPAGSQLPAAPPELTLRFTESIEPLFSAIELRDASGSIIRTDNPRLVDGSTRVLVIALPKLPPGRYSVSWHATSVDTHKTEGRYEFTIGP